MCKNPELAAQVTLLPIEKFKLDAAIIFSDILLPLEPMGVEFEFAKGRGSCLPSSPPGDEGDRKAADHRTGRGDSFSHEGDSNCPKELEGKIPLIGFSGAPFTLASYMIEGGHSKNYILTKGLMYQNRPAWDALDGEDFRGVDPVSQCPDPGGGSGPSAFRLLGGMLKSQPIMKNMSSLFQKGDGWC